MLIINTLNTNQYFILESPPGHCCSAATAVWWSAPTTWQSTVKKPTMMHSWHWSLVKDRKHQSTATGRHTLRSIQVLNQWRTCLLRPGGEQMEDTNLMTSHCYTCYQTKGTEENAKHSRRSSKPRIKESKLASPSLTKYIHMWTSRKSVARRTSQLARTSSKLLPWSCWENAAGPKHRSMTWCHDVLMLKKKQWRGPSSWRGREQMVSRSSWEKQKRSWHIKMGSFSSASRTTR